MIFRRPSDGHPPIAGEEVFHEGSLVGLGQIALFGVDARIDEGLELFHLIHLVPTLLRPFPGGSHVQTARSGGSHAIQRFHKTKRGLK